jgi:UDP-N-acetylglucosamine diphosphorylase/glucosamine-1-phosphate N-acetyltransferase
MPKAILFDDGLGQLAPLTDTRAAFDIRTGARTTYERLVNELELEVVALFTAPALANLTLSTSTNDAGLLVINGRCAQPLDEIARLEPGQCLVEGPSGQVIAMCIGHNQSARAFLDALAPIGNIHRHEHHVLLSRPWHVRTFRDACMMVDLVDMATLSFEPKLPGITFFGEFPISIAPSAMLYPGTILDLENGPIVIDEHAVIRPGCTIIGPAFIGPHSTVLDRTLIKAYTALGPYCKAAGEIGGTIFQGFANKAHDGHLGDSYVGEWSNLGAGTTNSNLLNTYDIVTSRATPRASMEKTGQQFLGAIIGDHVKTAICTRLMTGCIVNSGVMWAATAPITGCVPAMSWVTDEAKPGTKYFRFEKFESIARTVMARRKVTPTPAYIQRLREVHADVQGVTLA